MESPIGDAPGSAGAPASSDAPQNHAPANPAPRSRRQRGVVSGISSDILSSPMPGSASTTSPQSELGGVPGTVSGPDAIDFAVAAPRPPAELAVTVGDVRPTKRDAWGREITGTGLLLEREVLQREDDFGGHEIKPKSLVATSNLTIMHAPNQHSLAVPAVAGSPEWKRMRSGYLLEREKMLREQHAEAISALAALQTEYEQNPGRPMERGPSSLYAFAQQLLRTHSALQRVIVPIQRMRGRLPFLPDVVPPPENEDHTFDPEFTEPWVTQTSATVEQIMATIKGRAGMLAKLVNDAIAESDEEQKQYGEGKATDDNGEYTTFFVRKADPKSCSNLLDSLTLCSDALHGRNHFDFSAQRVSLSKVGDKMRAAGGGDDDRNLGTLSYSRMLLPDTWALVRNAPLFRSSVDGSELMHEIASKLRPLLFSPDTLVIKQGTIGMSMYFVNSGACRVAVNSQDIATRKPGDFFGEMALTLVQDRMADVYADGTTELFELSRGNFNDIIKRYPHVYERIRAVGTARVKKSKWEDRLTESEKLELLDDEHLAMSSDLNEVNEAVHGVVDDVVVEFSGSALVSQETRFEGHAQQDVDTQVTSESIEGVKTLLQNNALSDEVWSAEMWAAIVSRLKRLKAAPGVQILKKGDAGKNLYIVEAGEIRGCEEGVHFWTRSPGSILGTEALFLSGTQQCDLEAGPDGVSLLKLAKEALVDLLSAYPVFYEFLVDTAAVAAQQRELSRTDKGLGNREVEGAPAGGR